MVGPTGSRLECRELSGHRIKPESNVDQITPKNGRVARSSNSPGTERVSAVGSSACRTEPVMAPAVARVVPPMQRKREIKEL
jgi:hypothetical protein